MVRSKITVGMALAIALAAAPAATAAVTISNGTALVDTGSNWRTGSAAFGTAGYYIPGAAQRTALPSFVASVVAGPEVYGGNSGYALIDDPNTTPGAAPTKLRSGTFNPFPGGGQGQTATPFTFTLAANTPSSFRVGLLVDNLDIAAFNAQAIRLATGSTTSATFSLGGTAFNNRSADWIFFDVTGAQAGQTFSVFTTAGINGCGCLGGVAFDTLATPPAAVPEPATWAMMLVGFGAIGYGMRGRRKTSLSVS